MKTKISFILVLIFAINIYSQSGIVTYKTKKTIERKTSRPEMARKIKEEVNRFTYQLLYKDNKSFFKKDKIIPLYPFEAKFATIFTRSNKDWYQFNDFEKKTAFNKKISNKEYVVNDNSKMNNWKLVNETKIIDGYICYKAISTETKTKSGKIMKNIAWYTPDIPVPFGPIGNGGLPGLILKLEVANNFYYLVDKITLNPKKTIKIPNLKKGEKISSQKMVELMRKARKVTKD